MTTKPKLDEYIARVKRIDWISALEPTQEAEALLREYACRVGVLAKYFQTIHGWTLLDTDTYIAGVGMQLPTSPQLIDALFEATEGVQVKEHLVFNLHGYYFWDTDPELASFKNPYEPLFKLYEQGYTTAGGVADGGGSRLEMSLGSREGVREYIFEI
jgi:hypothetical protein